MNRYNLYPCFDRWCREGSVYIYSDPHFSDDEMKYLRKDYIGDEEQVKRINSKIGKKDTIIFLGDIGNIDFVKKIRGYKVLIKGNHDTGSANYRRVIEEIEHNSEYCPLCGGKVICDFMTLANCGPDFAWCKKCGTIKLQEDKYSDNHLFDEVYEGPLMISEKIILSHEPIKNINWALNIHGHDHSNIEVNDGYHLNLCAEYINYTPVCLKHIIESGVLKNIDSIHRITIDNATERSKRKKNK